jgi:hypothetical protein
MIDDLQQRRNHCFCLVIMFRVVFYLTPAMVVVNRCIDREYDKCLRYLQNAKLIQILSLGPRRGVNWHEEGFRRDSEFGSALRDDNNSDMLIENHGQLNLIGIDQTY